jgi:glycosyltransferase involved in cell wall biosynthesis
MGKNKSLVSALNQGIDAAKGKFIARMDADDIALPHRFERQLSWLDRTGADISGSWIKRFGNKSKKVIKAREIDAAIKTDMLFCCPFKHPTVMMRTELAKALRYDSAYYLAEDYDLWERAAEAGWKMTNVQEVLLLYRVHGTQASTVSPEKQLNRSLQVRLRYWEFISQKMAIDNKHVKNFSKLFEVSNSKPKLDEICAVVINLLELQTAKEACDVLIDHMALQYMLASKDSLIMIVGRNTLFSAIVWYKQFLFQLILWFIYLFQIHPEKRRGLSLLNQVYFNIISSSWKK